MHAAGLRPACDRRATGVRLAGAGKKLMILTAFGNNQDSAAGQYDERSSAYPQQGSVVRQAGFTLGDQRGDLQRRNSRSGCR